VIPSGLAWIWWGVRTNFTNPAKIKRRLTRLRNAIGKLRAYPSDGSVSARQIRRASSICHVTKPGMPRPISRARAIKESAKAPSPEYQANCPQKDNRIPGRPALLELEATERIVNTVL